MTEHKPASSPRKKGLAFAHFAFMTALVTPLFLLGVMMSSNLGYISYDLGFRTLTLGVAPRLALAAMVVSSLSLLISLFMAPKRCGPWALAAVVITGCVLGGFWWYRQALRTHPPIGDVATDWDRPITFSSKLIQARGPDARPVEDLPRVPRNDSMEWGGKTVAEINAMTCPGARSLPKKQAITAERIVAMLKNEGYVVSGVSDWRVEGTHRDAFYGFRSDVVVRLDGGRIDLRSVGRYPMPDLGGNCRRVTNLVRKIAAL